MDENKEEFLPAIDVINHILPYTRGKLKWKIESLPEEFLSKSAEELESDQKITETDKKLRLLFHKELSRAISKNDKMVVAEICKGVCHANNFLLKLDDPKKLAWLLLPYQDEEVRIKHQVNEAHEAIESLLHIDIYLRDAHNRKCGLDYKAAELKYKAAKMIYDRAYPATQKISYTKNLPEPTEQTKSIEDKIRMLEEKLKDNG